MLNMMWLLLGKSPTDMQRRGMAEQDDLGNRRSPRRFVVAGGVAAAVVLSTAVASSASAAPLAAAGATRAVTYHGYTVSVPASWPVYNLADDPGQCVLLNKHAVYLGTPGASQHCPSRAYGRTEPLLIQPSTAAATAGSSAQPAVVRPRDTAALPDTTSALPAAARTAVGASHVFKVDASGPGVFVNARYGTDPGTIRKILAGATMTGQASAPASSPSTAVAPASRAVTPTATKAAAAAQTTGTGTLTEMTGSGPGFDTCTAPSVATMT